MKRFIQNFLLALTSVVFAFIAMEGALYFFPVTEGLRSQPVNKSNPVLHFEPNRTFMWSNYANLALHNQLHANNYGYINDQDYDPNGKLPLIAVVGDSYVEAAMVPYKDTLQGRLASDLAGKNRVYSFGASGAPLSQYLVFADFARRTFHPSKLIIVVVTNDFDESLLHYKQAPGFHYFKKNPDGLVLTRVDYKPSSFKSLLTHSRLCMYLFADAKIQYTLSGLFSHSTKGKVVGQTMASTDSDRVTRSKEGVDAFFDLLPEASGLPAKDVIFVVDAIRPHLYTPEGRAEAKGSYADILRNYFLSRASSLGYQPIDMTGPFLRDYEEHGQRLEFKEDAHWNSRGHAVVEQCVLPLLH